VLFVSLNSFIDIQNRYLLNVENMTVGGDTKEPRERASRYATGVLLFSTKRRRETQRSRLKNVSSIHHEIKKGIRRILYSDLMITSKLTVCACARARARLCVRVCVCVCVCTGISHRCRKMLHRRTRSLIFPWYSFSISLNIH